MAAVVHGGPSRARGLAVLCGWAGGRMKHVVKHAELWHRLGWRTASVTMPWDEVFFPARWTSLPSVVQELARVVRRHRAEHADDGAVCAAHVFSNAGALCLLSLLSSHEEAAAPLAFDGVVYDSTPSNPRHVKPYAAPIVIGMGAAGLSSRELVSTLARHTPHAIGATMAMPAVGVPPPLGLFPRLFEAGHNPPRPELLVYGTEDALIGPHEVEHFGALRERQGAAVRRLRLEGSGHCSHMLTHPDRYAAEVEAFVKRL